MSDTETIKIVEAAEPAKPSKLEKAKSIAATTAVFVLPTVVMVGASYLGYRMARLQFDAARLNLETAKLYKA